MRILIVVTLGLLAGCASQPQQVACTTPADKDVAPIVRISTQDGGEASGVVVGHNRVLTAAHVIEDLQTAKVKLSENTSSIAAIIAVDKPNDMALLVVNTGNLKPIRLSKAELSFLEPVWAVGFPLATSKTLTSGYFKTTDRGTLHTTADINFGNSGGGLLRCHSGKYELAGMVRGFGAYRSENGLVKIKNLSMSVPASKIDYFIRTNGI